ncbi:hypothetical protein RESH_01448 [Rhodopirellula europaea SH398]|uniref:Uncharacterized protein n=1 Tax=Rhodopirellula europaea SH398 TaxID=1263868 RepID=M5S8S1_9BACT|nr:hypothetical protein RESH_01448 [Rhodopirellula europaea SH398]
MKNPPLVLTVKKHCCTIANSRPGIARQPRDFPSSQTTLLA